MHDVIVQALLHGVPGSERPWRDDDVAFLCPVPGYDRHFAICEALGIRMIAVPPAADGGLDLAAIASYLADPSVRGMWVVPMYANPTGAHPRRGDGSRTRLAPGRGPRLPAVLGQRLRRAPPHRRRARGDRRAGHRGRGGQPRPSVRVRLDVEDHARRRRRRVLRRLGDEHRLVPRTRVGADDRTRQAQPAAAPPLLRRRRRGCASTCARTASSSRRSSPRSSGS